MAGKCMELMKNRISKKELKVKEIGEIDQSCERKPVPRISFGLAFTDGQLESFVITKLSHKKSWWVEAKSSHKNLATLFSLNKLSIGYREILLLLLLHIIRDSESMFMSLKLAGCHCTRCRSPLKNITLTIAAKTFSLAWSLLAYGTGRLHMIKGTM